MSSNTENSFLEMIRNLDYFSVTFLFRIGKKPKYGSVLGGIAFIIFLITAILYTIVRFFDYISWADSKITYIEKSVNPAPPLNLKEMNFSYAVRLTFDNDTPLQNTEYSDLFILEQNYVHVNGSQNPEKDHSIPHKCTDNDFYNKTSDFPIFSKYNLSSFDCFEIKENYSLEGIYTDPINSYLEISLKISDKFFTDYEKLKEIFVKESFKFTLYYIDIFNDVTEFNEPVFSKINSIYSYLDLSYFKRNNINFQKYVWGSDKNLFYNDYKHENYIKFFSNQEIMAPISDRLNYTRSDNKNMYKFIMKAINNVKIVRFSFVKIPDFLASLSGLLLNLLLVLTVIFNLFNYFDAKQNIISKIMKYKDFITKGHKKALDYLERKFINAEKEIQEKNTKNIQENYLSPNNKNSSKSKYNKNKNVDETDGDAYNNYKCNDIDINNKYNNDIDNYCNDFIKGKEEFFPVIRSKDSDNNSIKERLTIRENQDFEFDQEKNNKKEIINYINTSNSNDKITLKINNNQNINNNCDIIKKKTNTSVNDIEIENNLESLNESLNSEIYKNDDNSKENNPYLLKISDFFCLCCRSKTIKKKINIFTNAEMKFNYNLDLVTYMKKMQEIEILKFLILDKDTIRLMNFIAKPSISFTNKEINDTEYDLFFSERKKINTLDENNIDNVKIAFDNILTKKKLKTVDKRILKLFKLQVEDLLN
jgi:hypothetical protein